MHWLQAIRAERAPVLDQYFDYTGYSNGINADDSYVLGDSVVTDKGCKVVSVTSDIYASNQNSESVKRASFRCRVVC